jgi:UDP-3-O-[3-hydroxymyristoyl] glucosamine N-acyltransferase
MRLSALASQFGAEIYVPKEFTGDQDPDLSAVAPIESADVGQITFFNNKAYAAYLGTTKASALIVGEKQETYLGPQMIHKHAYWLFAKVAQVFHRPVTPAPGISPKATVADSAKIGKEVTVMPGAYIGEEVVIGDRTIVYPNVYVHDGVRIGDDCTLHPSVVLHGRTKIGDRVMIFGGAVLGADGFGFAPGPDGLAKIPQVGGVEIGNDVEIGANTTIDCGAMADTVVGNGCKLDSHVHIAHNVQLGEHTMICGMSAIAGSAKLKNRVIVGGQSCVNNHCVMEDGTILGGHSALTQSVSKPGAYLGFPAEPAADWRRMIVRIRKLADYEKRLRALEKK